VKKSLGAKTIVYPTPVFVVGTYDAAGKANVMTAAWGGICCSKPPCVAVSIRRAPYTHDNIVAQRAFTINIPSEKHVRVADYFGIVSGKKVDKLAKAGLTAVKSTLVNAPYIAEFPFALECKLVQQIELGLHTQFVGEILDIKADEEVVNKDGALDIEKIRPFFFAPEAQAYYGMGAFLGKAFHAGRDLAEGKRGGAI
jgi:flavin reductase (DIM6/NTAB) family NADH-FMN oxidoreductase RutF